jgi:hypothetical protein
VKNKFTRAVDFWLDSIVVGFITKFAVDTTNSYNKTEKEFLRGPRGMYIRSLYMSMKILLYNKGVMTMESDSYTSLCTWGKGGSIDRERRNGRRKG